MSVSQPYNSWVEVDVSVLAANIRALRSALSPQSQVIFVVKSNAYGHNLQATAREAAAAGIRWFGVAHLHEALAIRAIIPHVNILVMGAVDPQQASLLARENITPMIMGAEHGEAIAAVARQAGVKVEGHLKVDTGMGRLGVLWQDAVATYRFLSQQDGLSLTGLCSHFAAVEPRQPERAETQVERFLEAADAIEAMHEGPLMKHISSSRAISYHKEWDFDAVRPGICLYGYGASDPAMRFQTRPVLQWKCRVMQVKDVPADFPVGYYGTYKTEAPTRMAILSAGYADGYHRALSNRGHVLIRGRRCRVIGRVSMNWITVDVGQVGDVAAGDEAVLIGQQGSESVWAGELARICRTIPYEILVGIHSQAPRSLHAHNVESELDYINWGQLLPEPTDTPRAT